MSTESSSRADLTRTLLLIGAFGSLVGGSLYVLRPFLLPLVWATILVTATWPGFLKLERRLAGRRRIAVGIAATAMLVVIVVPVLLAVMTIARHADKIAVWSQELREFHVPAPPEWAMQGPFETAGLGERWAAAHAATPAEIQAELAPRLRSVGTFLAHQVSGVGWLVINFFLMMAFAGVLFADGEHAAKEVRRFAHRLGGDRGDAAVVLAGNAIRAVALGVGVTAVVQSAIAGLGLLIAGVPFAGLLTAIIFVLCIAQLGPTIVLVPVVASYFMHGHTGRGAFLIVVLVLAASLDNVLRPLLIKRGADLPLLLIFLGVIGGMLAFGIVGLFIGPVVLSVSYALYNAWVTVEGLPPEVVPDVESDPAAPALIDESP